VIFVVSVRLPLWLLLAVVLLPVLLTTTVTPTLWRTLLDLNPSSVIPGHATHTLEYVTHLYVSLGVLQAIVVSLLYVLCILKTILLKNVWNLLELAVAVLIAMYVYKMVTANGMGFNATLQLHTMDLS
jgi:hypothetical protein